MNMDYTIIAIAWAVTAVLLVVFIPKDKIREALVVATFVQTLTWMIGLLVVDFGLIEYPVRLLPHTCKTSITFEFFIYPSICAIFNIHYPKKQRTVWSV